MISMTEKRFISKRESIINVATDELVNTSSEESAEIIVGWLNAQHERIKKLEKEKEDWKSNCLSSDSENSMLWNEIAIMREQGAKPSDAFEEYLDKISTEHTRFWKRKLNKAREDKVIK